MAQVTWDTPRNLAVVTFDEPDMKIVDKALRRDPAFLQDAVIELLRTLGRHFNQEIMEEKIALIRQGRFDQLPIGLG